MESVLPHKFSLIHFFKFSYTHQNAIVTRNLLKHFVSLDGLKFFQAISSLSVAVQIGAKF